MRRLLPAMLIAALPLAPALADEADEIRALTDTFASLWNAGDAAAMAAAYTPDGSLKSPFEAPRGREAIAEAFAGLLHGPLKGSTTEFEVAEVEILDGGIAVADAIQTVTGMTAPDGTALPPQKFVVTMVLEEESDGWAYRAVRVSFAAPAP